MPIQLQPGSIQTLLDTELNSLANGSAANDGGTYDNSNASNRFIKADFELAVTFGTAPTNGALVELYLREAADGTNLTDDADQPGVYVGGFVVRNVTSAQRILIRGVELPAAVFKARVVNRSGQAFPASGSTVRMLPYRLESA